MIDKALQFLTKYLSKELVLGRGALEDTVVASNLISLNGSVADGIDNKVVLSIINLEQETYMQQKKALQDDKGIAQMTPSINLNLYVLVSVNYDASKYLEGLKMLSAVVGVFQATPYFVKDTFPTMPALVSKLTVEIYNTPIAELGNLWNAIGSKYVPSILYKVRMVSIQEGRIKGVTPKIKGLGNTLKT